MSNLSKPLLPCVVAQLALAGALCRAAEDPDAVLLETLRPSAGNSRPEQKSPTDDTLRATASAIRHWFDEWLVEPARYRRLALRECGVFPEGKIYPFALPAIAYANLAIGGDIDQEHASQQMRRLLDLAIAVVSDQVRAPANDLRRLRTYRRHGTYLGTLNYALGAYGLVSDDGRYDAVHRHVSELLGDALREKNGAPIDSYPEYMWYFDTVMAIASLDLYDRVNRTSLATPLLDSHLRWRREHAIVADTGLPRAFPGRPSRGCDLSMQIYLLGNLRPSVARELYRAYAKHHWIDYGFAAGFTEWPKGSAESTVGDFDSGPLFLEIGCTASGVGIGAAKAVGDKNRLKRLSHELTAVSKLIRGLLASESNSPILSWFGDGVPMDERYYSGFLYGDVALFYAITWTEYPDGRKKAKRPCSK